MSANKPDDVVAVDSTAYTDGASRLLKRGIATADVDRLRRAVSMFEAVLAANPAGSTGHTAASVNAAGALVNEFELTGNADALERAIGLLDDVEPDSPWLGGREADFFSVLGHALLRDAERTGLPARVERAVEARRRALQLTSKEDELYPARLSDLGSVLAVQFRLTGAISPLREAVKVHEGAVRQTPPESPGLPGGLSNLGTCLDELAIRTGDLGALVRAVTVQREALNKIGSMDPLRPMVASNLAISLLHLYEETADRTALVESVALQRAAAEETPEGHVEYYPRRTNLAVALQSLYEQTGDIAALDEAIEIFRQAVAGTPPLHANRFRYLHSLASALMRLAERTGDLSGTDEAIWLWQDVVDGTPDEHPNKPGRLSALATASYLRFLRDPADTRPLKAGIGLLRRALGLIPPGHTQQAMLMTNLGTLLLSLFEQTGERDTLDEAIRLSRQAVAAAPPGHSNRGQYLSNLGVALVHQAQISDDNRDAGQAVTVLGQALEAICPDDPGRAQTLLAQGAAYARTFELGDTEALSHGLKAFRGAADMGSAPTAVRIRAGRDRGRLAASGGQFDEALAGFGNAVRLMEEAAWAGLGRSDQQRLLSELNGLPMDAAAMAIEADNPGNAVELLEQGRGVLLSRRIEAPSLHAQLQSRAPDLAEQLAWVQNAIDQTSDDTINIERGDTADAPRDLAARRNRLAREREAILEQLRSRPDLQDLAGLNRLDSLLTAAARGPVVMVNVSEYRCDALILSEDRVHPVRLPELTKEDVAEQVQHLLDAADAANRHGIDDALKWTWARIVEPIFNDLGLTAPTVPSRQTHLWWCATGLTAFLPLHAAGDYDAEGQTPYGALDLTVSSYTPTLRTLTQLRQREPTRETGHAGPLIVAMPHAPGLADLDSTQAEAADLARRFPAYELLTGPSATRDEVAQAMPDHLWAHYACHGSQKLLEPDSGALHLYDGPLTIPQIMKLQLPNLAFAYLSACETNRGSTTIPDEGITLASALQLAGYQHVIATLWPISGLTALDIARHLYDQLVTEHDGNVRIDSDNAAIALRKAVVTIRTDSPELPAMYWAPYVHTGP
jgi:tetratricopeptide (TPR) repeat protein